MSQGNDGSNFMLNAQLQALLQQQQQQQQQQQPFQQPQQPQQQSQQQSQILAQLQQMQQMQMQGHAPRRPDQQQSQQPWNQGNVSRNVFGGQVPFASGQPQQNTNFPISQNQMQQQHQQHQQQQPQPPQTLNPQQGMHPQHHLQQQQPWHNNVQMPGQAQNGFANPANGQHGGQMTFNPFNADVSQQPQQQGQFQRGAGQVHAGPGAGAQASPSLAPSFGAMGGAANGAPMQNLMAQQMQNQSSQHPGQQQLAGMPFGQDGQNFDTAAFLNAINASMGGGGNHTMQNGFGNGGNAGSTAIDPALLLQQLSGGLGGMTSNVGGPQGTNVAGTQQMPQPQAGQPQAAQAQAQAAGQAGSPKTAGTPSAMSTPEPKAKGRPKGSTKKKKEEQQQHSQSGKQAMPGQRPPSRASQGPVHYQAPGPYPQTAPSPASSMKQTPTQTHASIPLASPARAFAQMQERSRSQTRSPAFSTSQARPNDPNAMVRPFPGAPPQEQAQATNPSWAPSLLPHQQQQLLSQAMSVSKAQSSRAQSGGQPTQHQTPAHVLMQMGYVFVNATKLPNNGAGAGIPGGPTGSGPGAILSIDEANAIGVFGNQPRPGPLTHGQDVMNQPQMAQQAPFDFAQSQQRPPMQLQGVAQPPQMLDASSQMPFQQPQAQQSSDVPFPMQVRPGMDSSDGFAPSAQPMSDHLRMGTKQMPIKQGNQEAEENISRGQSSGAGQARPVVKRNSRSRQASSSTTAAPSPGPSQALSNGTQAPASPAAPNQNGGPKVHQQGESSSQIIGQSGGARGGGLGGIAPNLLQNLPPLRGGRLPAKTKQGYEISAEFNTRFTPLPSSDALDADGKRHFSELWKPMTKDEEKELLEIMRKDHEYTKLMSAQSAKNNGSIIRRAKAMQPIGRLHWWERGMDENPDTSHFEDFKILLPADKRSQRAAQGLRSATLNGMTPRQMQDERKSAASLDEALIPVRIELDHEGWKLRDTFTWPAPETYKTEMLDRFATILCEDIGLPVVHFVHVIRESILSQVAEHNSAEAIRPVTQKRKRNSSRRAGQLSSKELEWWKHWREKVEAIENGEVNNIEEIDSGHKDDNTDALIGGIDLQNLPSNTGQEAELRIQIKLDITVGAMNLTDQFEWDISDEGSSAEEFATAFAADLGLSGEFKTAVAHSIREQVDAYVRSLVLVGYGFDGRDVYDDELRSALLPNISTIARSDVDIDAHTPKLVQLSEAEITQLEKEREREARRKRRQTRGRRGVNLPDRDPLKTTRTPVVIGLQTGAQGADGYTASAMDQIIGTGREASASTRATAGISTRRAAAIVANASIANAAANEYGTPTPAPEGPSIALNGRNTDKESAKRRKLDSYATHFEYPGGLGSVDDEADEERDRGPNFTIAEDESLKHGPEPRAAELGSIPASTKQTRQILASGTNESSAPGSPMHWSAAKIDEASHQIPNWYEGQWYCSNCGVPGNMDPTRRKGPLGEKSLCGICGKYFHRHRKARPVLHTRDLYHHAGELRSRGIVVDLAALQRQSQKEAEAAAASASPSHTTEGAPPAMQRAHPVEGREEPSMDSTSAQDDTLPQASKPGLPEESRAPEHSEPYVRSEQTLDEPRMTGIEDHSNEQAQMVDAKPELREVAASEPARHQSNENEAKSESKASRLPVSRGDSPELPFEQVGSPDDSESSRSTRNNSPKPQPSSAEAGHRTSQPPSATRSESPTKQQPATPSQAPLASTPQAAGSPPAALSNALPTSAAKAPTPEWLVHAFRALSARYPLDRFEVLPRRRQMGVPPSTVTEWRIRCIDCPGKLYTPGPDETLSNFEIHLKNRAHRANVQKAVALEGRTANNQ